MFGSLWNGAIAARFPVSATLSPPVANRAGIPSVTLAPVARLLATLASRIPWATGTVYPPPVAVTPAAVYPAAFSLLPALEVEASRTFTIVLPLRVFFSCVLPAAFKAL